MKLATYFFFVSSVMASAQTNIPIIMLNGSTTMVVRITRVEPDGITTMSTNGITKYDFKVLAPDERKRFGFDPNSAEKFKAETAVQQTKFVAAQKSNAAIQRELESRATSSISESAKIKKEIAVYVEGSVDEIFEDGFTLACSMYLYDDHKSGKKMIAYFDLQGAEYLGRKTMFILNNVKPPVGDRWSGKVIRTGERKINGATVGVHSVEK